MFDLQKSQRTIAEVGLQTKNAKQVQHHEVAGVKMTIFPSTTFNVPFHLLPAGLLFLSKASVEVTNNTKSLQLLDKQPEP